MKCTHAVSRCLNRREMQYNRNNNTETERAELFQLQGKIPHCRVRLEAPIAKKRQIEHICSQPGHHGGQH